MRKVQLTFFMEPSISPPTIISFRFAYTPLELYKCRLEYAGSFYILFI